MRRILVGFSILIAAALAASLTQAAPYDSWVYRAKITISGYDKGETLTNFPVLIRLGPGVISGFSYSDCGDPAGGGDLRFSASNGIDELDYEIEKWDSSGISYVWVEVPQITGASDFVYVYWGNAGATARACTTNGAAWRATDLGVYHLGATNGVSDARDFTAFHRNGTVNGTTNVTDGIAGGGQGCGGAGWITGPMNISSYGVSGAFTLTAWVRSRATGYQCLISDGNSYSDAYGYLFINPTSYGLIGLGTSSGWANDDNVPVPFTLNEWHQLVERYDGALAQLFFDGALVRTLPISGTVRAGSQSMFIGRRGDGYIVNGDMDEVRLSSSADSSNWIWACYMTTASNAAFQTYAAAEAQSRPIIANRAATNVTATSAWVNGYLSSTGDSPVTVSVYWGPTDGGDPTSGLWQATNTWPEGTWVSDSAPTLEFTSLTPNTFYYYRFYATNHSDHSWAAATERFLAGDITVTAPDNAAVESVAGTDTGTFTIQRDATATNETLTVTYAFSGTATYGTDYTVNPAGTSVTLPAGVAETNLTITALWDNNTNEGPETIWLTLQPGAYGVGAPASNSITIADRVEKPYALWPFRSRLTLGAGLSGTLANFPLLVRLDTSITNFTYSQFASPADGADLRFTAADQLTPLNYEIEKWDSGGTSYVWVQVPALADSTAIYAYWGRSAAALPCTTNGTVWDASFRGVWHLPESGATCRDATMNGNTAGKLGNVAAASGVVDGAQTFDGSADYMDCGTAGSLDMPLPRTVSAWVTPNALKTYTVVLSKDLGHSDGGYSYIMTFYSDGRLAAYDNSAWRWSGSTGMTTDQPYLLTYVTPGDGSIYFYVNGNAVGSDNWNHSDNAAHNVYLGSWNGDTSHDFNGVMDEVRLECVARDSAWITACYQNQKTNGTFVDYGAALLTTNLSVEAYPATEIRAYSAKANGGLAVTNTLPTADVYVCWGYADAGVGDTGTWFHVTFAGNLAEGQSFSLPLTNLSPGSGYVYRCYATNTAGAAWSSIAKAFTTRAAWYVSAGGDGADGLSWATAFTNLQPALDAATGGAEIYVAGGMYPQTTQIVWSVSGASVYGGCEGVGTPGNRDPALWPTILFRDAASTNRIMLISGVTGGLLEGVTLTGGYIYNDTDAGGGLALFSVNGFTVAACTISNNFIGYYGGGIYVDSSSGVTLDNCLVAGNTLDVHQRDQPRSGAGIYSYNSTLTVTHCALRNNLARNTLYGYSNTQPSGGGIGMSGGRVTLVQTLVISNVVQTYNIDWLDYFGGGAYVAAGTHTFLNCLFTSNAVNRYDGRGQYADGIEVMGGSLNLANCTVVDNGGEGVRVNSTGGAVLSVSNSIIYTNNGVDVVGSAALAYSCIGNTTLTLPAGCFTNAPQFADGTYYHVESTAGRYTDGFFSGGTWAAGATDSPTIDAGDPAVPAGAEPEPNGARLNMGYDGGTAVAAKSLPLSLRNLPPEAVTPVSATLVSEVVRPGSANVQVWFYWGPVNGADDPGAWESNAYWGVVASTGAVTHDVSGLTAPSYYYTIFASNSAGAVAWASPSTNFSAEVTPPVVVNAGVLNETGPAVTLKGAITSTGGDEPQVYVCWGATEGGPDTGAWEHVEALGPRNGAFETIVATEAGSNYFYTCYATNLAGDCWAAPNLPFGAYRIRYVDQDATGTGTGYSWTNAFTSIQDALNSTLNGKSNLICIKSGSYLVSSSLSWTGAQVTVRGGYAGEGSPGAPQPDGLPTVLTNLVAELRILTIDGGHAGTIENVTVSGGNMTGNGGGLSIANTTNFTLRACRITGNRAIGSGGGLALTACSGVVFDDTRIENNRAYGVNPCYGGGLYASASAFVVTNCLIRRNWIDPAGSAYGGGVFVSGGQSLFRDTVLGYNRANSGYGGGLYANSGTHLLLNDVIIGNDASAQAGGIGVNSGTVTGRFCTIAGNNLEGVRLNGGACSLRNSIVWQNDDDIVGAVSLANSDVQDGDGAVANGCISNHPLFEYGLYLGAGSPCTGLASESAADAGLAGYTTRADGTPDTGLLADIGYHAPAGMPLAAADIYVAKDGSDDHDGTTWGSALQTLTKAFKVAIQGSRVHVGAGLWTTNDATFPLAMNQLGVQLFGTNTELTVISAAGSNVRAIDMSDDTFGQVIGLTVSDGGMIPYVGSGAGINALNADEAVIAACTLTNNRAGRDGAGLYVGNSESVTVTNCVFLGNILDVSDRDNTRVGGGFYGANSYGILSNCLFDGNITRVTQHGASTTMTRGGGLGLSGGAWTVAQAAIVNNTTHSDTFHGYNARAAGFYIVSGTHLFRNCLVANNSLLVAPQYAFGAGVDVAAGTLTLDNVTIATNGAEGLRIDGGTVVVSNSIVWGNILDLTNAAGTATLGYSDVGTPVDYSGSNGCLSVDPLFADQTWFHEQSTEGYYSGGFFSGGAWATDSADSPTIDMGDPAGSYANEPAPHGRRLNMGAYGNTPVASKTRLPRGVVFTIW